MLYVLLPPVVFFNLDASRVDLAHAVGLVLGIVAVVLAALAAWWLSSRVLGLARHRTGAVICCVLSINTGYLGYPLTVALLGRDSLSTAVLYDVLVSGPCLLLGAFAVGAAFGSRSGERPRDRLAVFLTRNPPLFAAIAGLLAPRALAPAFLVDASQALIVAILPLGFFAVGATLAENAERGRLPIPPRFTRPVAVAVLSRLLLAPALLAALAAPLIELPTAYRLMSAMPTGINSMVVAHAYGLDMEITSEAVAWSTALVIAAALASLVL
jgi:predicted permease